jgi:hypothetical protein
MTRSDRPHTVHCTTCRTTVVVQDVTATHEAGAYVRFLVRHRGHHVSTAIRRPPYARTIAGARTVTQGPAAA